MKAIYTFFAAAILSGFTAANAQTTAVCTGSDVCLVSNVISGSYQWQSSPDGITWSDIPSATNDTLCFTATMTGYVRMQVTTACGPVYSDTTHLVLLPNPVVDAGTGIGGACVDTLSIGGAPTGSGGTGTLTYSWTPTNQLSSPTVSNPFVQGIYGDLTYTVTVTDANGCSATGTVAATLLPYSVTYNFTGAMETFVPNPCFSGDTVLIATWGAQGGSGAVGGNSSAGGSGGLGGYAEGKYLYTTGTFNVFVGGQGATPTGGFNGGGNGGTQNAGGGGGATDVRFNGTAPTDRIMVAGGGGGGGRGGCESTTTITGGTGGDGGGGNGGNGTDAPTSGGSAGGGAGAIGPLGGAAGIGCGGFLGAPGSTTATETGGAGGAGQACCCFTFGSIPGGGGGGGGLVGGGGGGGGSAGTTGCSGNDKGAGGGGAGGTSSTYSAVSGVTNNGIWLGNGMVTFTFNP